MKHGRQNTCSDKRDHATPSGFDRRQGRAVTLVGRPVDADDRNSERGRQVKGSRIVCDQRGAVRNDAHQKRQIRSPDQINSWNVSCRVAILAAAQNHTRRTMLVLERRRQFGKARDGQRLAWPNAAPGARPTSGRSPRHPCPERSFSPAAPIAGGSFNSAVSGPVSMPSCRTRLASYSGKLTFLRGRRIPLVSRSPRKSVRYPHRSLTPARFNIHADRKEFGNRMPISPLTTPDSLPRSSTAMRSMPRTRAKHRQRSTPARQRSANDQESAVECRGSPAAPSSRLRASSAQRPEFPIA